MAEYTHSQLQAINIRGKNILVSASAGTGKTHAMIKRVIELIMGRQTEEINGIETIRQDESKRIPVDRILLITFTKAAAAEMKVRLHTELTRELHKCEEEELKEYLVKQIDLIPMSNISTIHAFCANLLREHFQELGISPLFEIADQDDDNSYQTDAILRVLDDESCQEPLDRLRIIFSERMQDDRISDIIIKIYNWAYSTEDPEKWLKETSISQYDKDIEESDIYKLYFEGVQRDANIILEQSISLSPLINDYDDCRKWLSEISEIFSNYAKAQSFEDIIKLPKEINKAPSIRKDKELNCLKNEVKELCKSFFVKHDIVMNFDKTKFSDDIKEIRQIVKDIIDLTIAFSDYYSKSKLKDNKLTFNDLEHYTVSILANEDLRKEISDRFLYVLVDEYQDINNLQELIISKVAKSDNLFMVGDVKQSIYRFRQAVPEIFINKEIEYSKGKKGETTSFTINFRSDKAILDYVNSIFRQIMTEEFGGINYAKKAMLQALNDEENKDISYCDNRKVSILTFKAATKSDDKDGSLPVYSLREHEEEDEDNSHAKLEAKIIYNKINELIDCYYYDIKTRSNKKITYKDMAILFRQRAGSSLSIIDYLREWGVPLNDSNFIKSSTSDEIKLLINLLRVIDNDDIEIPLVSVMRSFWGEFSDQDLANIKLLAGGNRLPYYKLLDLVDDYALRKKIHRFKDFIAKMRLKSNYMSVFDLLQDIVANTSFDSYCIAHDNGDKLYNNLNDYIFSLKDKSYASSVAKYLYYYDNYVSCVETNSFESNMDAVTVSTMHGAKGLEYPVVFIANSHSPIRSRNDTNYIIDRKLGLCFMSYDTAERKKSNNIVYTVMNNIRKQKELEDNLNLFYVALTRAKNYLIITGKENQTGLSCPVHPSYSKNFLEWAAYGANSKNYECIDIQELEEMEGNANLDKHLIHCFKSPDEEYCERIKKTLDYEYPYINSTKQGIKYSVSAINKNEDEGHVPQLPTIKIEDKKAMGTLSHKVMEHIDLKAHSMKEIDEELNRLREERILSQEEYFKIDKEEISKCLNSEVIRYASRNLTLREKSFMLRVSAREIMDVDINDEVLLQGTIDMLITGDKNILVDYKRTRIQDDKDIINTYIKQIDLYTLAIERILKLKIDKRIIYLFGQDREIIL